MGEGRREKGKQIEKVEACNGPQGTKQGCTLVTN